MTSRKTERGAIGSWIDSGVRAAPFALLKSNDWVAPMLALRGLGSHLAGYLDLDRLWYRVMV
jgi:hypothetical protein